MASYMDMVTVLMCLFIVLFAMSSVDAAKYEQLRGSLATGFGATDKGAVPPPETLDAAVEPPSPTELAKAEAADLRKIQERIAAALEEHGIRSSVAFTVDERGLTVRLVGSETFFTANSTALSAQALSVLGVVGPVLAGTTRDVAVEGHADNRSSYAPYATNWELSSGRAVQVLRNLVESGGFPAQRIMSTGFGDSRPLVAGTDDAALAQNRRVDIVVSSDESEEVRKLMAAAAAAAG